MVLLLPSKQWRRCRRTEAASPGRRNDTLYPLRNCGAGLPPGAAYGSRRPRLGRHELLLLLRRRRLLLHVLLRPQELLLLLSLRLDGRGGLHGLQLHELAAVP